MHGPKQHEGGRRICRHQEEGVSGGKLGPNYDYKQPLA